MIYAIDNNALLEPIQAIINKAYADGFKAGHEAAVAKLVQSVQSMAPATADPDAPSEPRKGGVLINGVSPATFAARAPRGALDHILEVVLAASPGMATPDVETAVLERDPRIAIKSVYNRLRHYEKIGRRFRRQNSLWYRIADIPAPMPVRTVSPQGETGGVAPPASSNMVQ
jgi:hypothetical protein